MYGGAVGVIGNTMGIFLNPVMQEMEWTRVQASYYMSISGLLTALFQPIAGRLFSKVDIRLILGTVVAVLCGAYAVSSQFHSLMAWNVFGVIIGVCNAFLFYLPIPILINSWFKKNVGLALGIAVAFSSITAVFANPVGNWLITEYGWRMARLIFGGVVFVGVMPFMVFVIRRFPEQKGLKAYGADSLKEEKAASGEAKGASFKEAMTSFSFWCFFLMACLIVTCASMHIQTPGYAVWKGLGSQIGATAVSVIMIGGITGKVFLGWLNDRIGIVKTGVFAMVVGIAGSIIAVAANLNVTIFFIGTFMFGVAYAALTIVPPLLIRTRFGMKNYSQIFSIIAFGLGIFGGTVAPMLYGKLYDIDKSFAIHWPLVTGMFAAALVLLLMGVATSKKTY
jgi:MFS family permease